uniref:Uncharacterized protein n=1 Tax=Peromyscus maniculatus bairdii TaxID=230844 RepID=A0A8C8U922_PERMB
MQDPDEDASGRTGLEEDEDGQHRPRASNVQVNSQSSVAESDQDDVPYESGPQDASSQSVPGVATEEEAVIPQDEQPPLLPRPSGEAATTASRLLEFSVRMPFPYAVEADMARRSLVTNAQHQLLMVPQEYTVNDTILAASVFQKSGVYVASGLEDPVLFQISSNSFLDQLSLVMRNIQHLQFMAVVKWGRGRSHNN